MTRRAPLALRVRLDGLGKTPKNAIQFEPGQAVGDHSFVRRTGSWNSGARVVLRCREGHEFPVAVSEIRRAEKGHRGPIRCQECRTLDRPAVPSYH